MTKYKNKTNGTITVYDEKGKGYIFSKGQTLDIYGKLIDESALERVNESKKRVDSDKKPVKKKKEELDDDEKTIDEGDDV